MTILFVPLHLPVAQARRFLTTELMYRKVISFKIDGLILIIEHEPLTHEDKAELLSCIEGPIIV